MARWEDTSTINEATWNEREQRMAAFQDALLIIARREAPGSDTDDWAEVEFARDALARLGVEWRRDDGRSSECA